MEAIQRFEAECAAFPKQYTPEWYTRRGCVGGSEIHAFMEARSAADCEKYIARKTGGDMSMETGMMPLILGWGNLFEPVLTEIVAERVGAVHCRSACLFRDCFRFSPDGLIAEESGATILEMKNPFMRKPDGWSTKNADQFFDPSTGRAGIEGATAGIKPEYYSQMQLGLHLLPFATSALFVEAIMRRVVEDSNNDYVYKKLSIQRDTFTEETAPICSGLLGLYAPLGTTRAGPPIKFYEFPYHDAELCAAIGNLKAKNPYTVFVGPRTNGAIVGAFEATAAAAIPAELDGRQLHGIMAWSMFGIRACRVHRDQNFAEALGGKIPLIREVLATLDAVEKN